MLDLSKYEGHTPGPWRANKVGDIIGSDYVPYLDGSIPSVAMVWGRHTPSDGKSGYYKSGTLSTDAALIADAPALLAELKALRESHAQLLHLAKAAAKEIKKAYANCRCDDGECSACLDNLDELAKADEAIKQAEAL